MFCFFLYEYVVWKIMFAQGKIGAFSRLSNTLLWMCSASPFFFFVGLSVYKRNIETGAIFVFLLYNEKPCYKYRLLRVCSSKTTKKKNEQKNILLYLNTTIALLFS